MKLDEPTKQAALSESQVWLTLLDAGIFVEGWDRATQTFKSLVTPKQFQSMMRDFMVTHGKVYSRKFKSIERTESLPNSPTGDYVLVEYETKSYLEPRPMIEVTPMINEDGKWKVHGHYFKLRRA